MPHWNVHFNLVVKQSDPKVIQQTASIHATARTIRDIPIPPSVQQRLHSLNIIRAVRGTTGIEGVTLTEDEVAEVLKSPQPQPTPITTTRMREEQEVRNANALMNLVEDVLRKDPNHPLTESLIRKFHEVLTQDIDYQSNEPGKYRSVPVTAGDYSAPYPKDVQHLMSSFIEWLNGSEGRKLDPVVRALVSHFLLISIHPFGDGNGRTSRAVEAFLLYKAGVNVRGFYSLANYYYQHRAEYVDLLNHVRFISDPDATPFVEFALRGLVEELEQVHSELIYAIKIISFRDYARQQLQSKGRLGTRTGDRQLHFLFRLGNQKVPLREIRTGRHPLTLIYRGVGAKTITRDIDTLVSLDLIVVEDGAIRANTDIMDRFVAGNIYES